MPVSDAAVLDAIETGFFLLAEVPGKLEHLRVPRLVGRSTSTSHPLANLVGMATLRSEEADETIRAVRERFAAEQKAFGWVVGPSSTPADLAERLTAAGLKKIDEMAGMVLRDLGTPIQANPAVRIRQATPEDMVRASGMLARAYGLPLDVAHVLAEAVLLGEDQVRVRSYLAEVEGSDEPVAFSFLFAIPNQPIVLLGGAATLPEHRGQGIYTSLVAQRLADARASGAEAAVIQAVRSTSAPICRKLGFEEVCGLDLYAWFPPNGTPAPGSH